MKRIIILPFLFLLITVPVFAQHFEVQKSTFVAKETAIFHANQTSALNTKTGQTLVVWEKSASSGHSILARVMNAAGNAITGQITLAAGPNVSHPSITYNPARNEFMLAYDDNPNVQLQRSDVYVLRLSPQGRPGGAVVKVSTDSISSLMANFFPKVVFNPNTSAYSMIWLREIASPGQASQGNNGLVGALMATTGALAGPVVMIQKTTIEANQLWGPIPLDQGYAPANRRLMIIFVQVQSGTTGRQAHYFLANLDPALNGASAADITRINNAPIALGAGFAWGARLALFSNTPGFLFFVDSANIKRRKLDMAGKLTGSQIVAFKAPKNNTKLLYPSVAFSKGASGTRGVLVAVQDPFRETGGASLWAQVIDATGIPIGVPARIDLTSSTDTALSANVTTLPQPPTATGFRFAAFYTLAQFKAPGQTFENSGIVKLNLNLIP